MAIYLDNNATTPVDPAVIETMLAALATDYGNPSSAHQFGATAARHVRRGREAVRALIGAAATSEIVFTSGGSESNVTALEAAVAARPDRDEVVVAAVEHPSVLKPLERLSAQGRIRLRLLPVDSAGRIDPAAVARLIGPRTALVSVQWANSETGVIQPVAEIAALARGAGALCHCDAVQAAGRLAIDVAATAIDLLSLSAHKINGPKGIGALYVRDGLPLAPLLPGGSQERGRRAGTENVPAIAGFGKAAELVLSRRADDISHMAALRDRLEARLGEALPALIVNGAGAPRLPNTSNIAVAGLDGNDLALLLDRAGIAVSTGSACRAGQRGPSAVLAAMAVPVSHIGGALRLSLGRDTTAADIDAVIATLPGLIAKLRLPGRAAA